MTDLQQRLAKGQEPAFVELYDQFGETLFAYVASRVADQNAAKDIIQDVFARLIRYHRHFKRVENLKAYLFQVARNEISRWAARKPVNTKETDADDMSAESSAESELEQRDWIRATLAQLDEQDREILSLKIFSELTFKELATVMDMPAATVATRYRRAIKKLEASIKEKT